jgi:branched-chain amino acid transport system ATP-binding protein
MNASTPLESVVFEARGISKSFAGLRAVNELNVTLFEGEIAGLIGPNGSGKSTFFNVVTGVDKPSAGRVLHRGEDITGWASFRIAGRKIARTFQKIRVFHNASALENVLVGCHLATRSDFFSVLFSTARYRRKERLAQNRALEMLDFVGLSDRVHELARNLPYGAIKRLEIARALVMEPELLMLDEPAAGLHPREAQEFMEVILAIRRAGKTVFVIEHNMKMVMALCRRIIVIDAGSKIAEGAPDEIRRDPLVRKAYLGGSG